MLEIIHFALYGVVFIKQAVFEQIPSLAGIKISSLGDGKK
jgi:hypothetical protein